MYSLRHPRKHFFTPLPPHPKLPTHTIHTSPSPHFPLVFLIFQQRPPVKLRWVPISRSSAGADIVGLPSDIARACWPRALRCKLSPPDGVRSSRAGMTPSRGVKIRSGPFKSIFMRCWCFLANASGSRPRRLTMQKGRWALRWWLVVWEGCCTAVGWVMETDIHQLM